MVECVAGSIPAKAPIDNFGGYMMINAKNNKQTVSVNVETDINSEISNRVETAINECIKCASKEFLRNISVEFSVTVK